MRMSCERTEDLLFDYCDGTLCEEENAAVKVHLAICSECRKMADLCAGLPGAVAAAPMAPMDPEAERLARLGRPLQVVGSPTRIRRGFRIAAAVMIPLAATAAAIALFGPAGSFFAPDDAPLAPPSADRAFTVSTAWQGGGRFELTEGVSAWFVEGTRATEIASGDATTLIRLDEGRVVIEIDDSARGHRFTVETSAGQVRANGTVFSVTADPRGGDSVRVMEGKVTVAGYGLDSGALEVRAGEEYVAGRSLPTPSSPIDIAGDLSMIRGHDMQKQTRVKTALETEHVQAGPVAAPEGLVRLAGAYRSVRDYDTASRIYETLIDTYPGNETAINAMVALGQMELVFMKRKDRAALNFSRYLELRPSGSLAHVAAEGRSSALGETP